MVSLVRVEPDAFTEDEVELVSLLGRFLGSAVQNIRAYEAEHATVEELRRLSALRADFVSMVSHEMRSPMAAVIGSASTLHERWRELTPEQRELVPRPHRARDEAAGRARRRRARHLAHRVGDLQLQLRGRRRRRADPRIRGRRRERPGRGEDQRERAPAAPADPRRPRAAAAGAHEPDRQRRQVLPGRRRGRMWTPSPRTGTSASRCGTAGPASPASTTRSSSRSSAGSAASTRSREPASASSSRARSPHAHGGTSKCTRLRRRRASSRSCSRRLSLRGEPVFRRSSRASAFARRATCLRRFSGSSRTASPRSPRISPTSHSSLPTALSASAAPSASARAPSSTFQRAIFFEYQMLAATAALLSRSGRKPSRGSNVFALESRAAHPVEPERALRVARAIPGVHVPVGQLPLDHVRLDEPRRERLLALLLVLDLDERAAGGCPR